MLPIPNHNWMSELPTNDDEALEFLRYGKTALTGDALCGLYEIKRLQGMSIMDAIQYALESFVKPKNNLKTS